MIAEDGEMESPFSCLCLHCGILAEAYALLIIARQRTSVAIRDFRHLFIINPLRYGRTNGSKEVEGAGEDIADLDLLEVGLCGSFLIVWANFS